MFFYYKKKKKKHIYIFFSSFIIFDSCVVWLGRGTNDGYEISLSCALQNQNPQLTHIQKENNCCLLKGHLKLDISKIKSNDAFF